MSIATQAFRMIAAVAVAASLSACSSEESSNNRRDRGNNDPDAAADAQIDAGGDMAQSDGGQDAEVDMSADMPADIGADAADIGADMAGGDADMAPGAWPAGVIMIPLDAAGVGSVTTDYTMGTSLASMDWARSPGVGCWTNPTEDEFFQSNHVSFAIDGTVDAWSDVTVTVTPNDPTMEVNPYVLVQGPNQFDVPTAVAEVDFCHRPLQLGPNTTTSVTFRVHAEGPNNVFIGVANRDRWANDDTGGFTVDVQVTPVAAPDRCYADVLEPGKFPPHVNALTLDPATSRLAVYDTLAGGAPPCELTYLNDQFCAPTTQFDRFQGTHKFYAVDSLIPADSFVTVTVTPDPGDDISLYGGTQSVTSFYVPPNYNVLGNCEASNDTTPGGGSNPGQVESFAVLTGTGDKNLMFAVAAPQPGVPDDEVGYTISIEVISTSTDDCTEADYNAVSGLSAWPTSVSVIPIDPNGMGSVQGDTTVGAPLCTLDWAASSQTACFPATENAHFGGNVAFYAIDATAGSKVSVTVTPEPDVDVSVVGYRIGPDSYTVPPLVPSVVNCEASYPFAIGTPANPGVIEHIEFLNPTPNTYQYFIMVAGHENGLHDGAYTIDVEITEPPPPHCPESLPGSTYPTWPGHVTVLPVDAQGAATGSGDLADGACMNLEFAAQSSVACFPATRFDRYEGNHVFYALDQPLPPESEMTITITPAAGVDINAYGIQAGTTSYPVPPAIPSALCEASYGLAGPNPGTPEVLFFSNPSKTSSYNIFFAVAGPTGTTAGAYDIDVSTVTNVTHCPQSLPGPMGLADWPANVGSIAFDASGDFTTQADLTTGDCVNLEFAENSSVACFPATRFDRYEGNHSFYALDQPMPPNSVLTVTLEPAPGVEANLYGMQIGSTEYVVPPAVPSAICEASYGLVGPNPGEIETIAFYNPSDTAMYNILVGVAGGRGVTSGMYRLHAHLSVGVTHCEGSLPGSSYDAWPSSVELVTLAGSSAQVVGDLSQGACTNLDWAASSQTACFPATDFPDFEGNHVFYALDAPLPPNTTATVTATSTSGTPISLYGYTAGTKSYFVPPYTPITVACEYEISTANTASIQLNTGANPFSLFFGVAGPSGATSGGYTIDVSTTP